MAAAALHAAIAHAKTTARGFTVVSVLAIWNPSFFDTN
jgi:hypothetical protein